VSIQERREGKEMTFWVGFDVGKTSHYLSVLDDAGEVVLSRRVEATEQGTTPRVRHPEQADRWTWLVVAAFTQLRLARALPIGVNRNLPAVETEQAVLHAVLDAVKERDELIRKANVDYQREREAILRSGAVDAGEFYRQLDSLERQRANYQRMASLEAISIEDLVDRTAELDRERDHIKRLLAEHESRQERLEELREAHERTVELIRRGKWAELGITAPETSNRRYREIGLSAQADTEGTITLSWAIGGESHVGATDLSSRRWPTGRTKSPLRPSRIRRGR
jgi:hypothetical protein